MFGVFEFLVFIANPFVLMSSIGMIIIGSMFQIFTFKFKGLIGLVLSYLGESVSSSFSIISLDNEISNSTMDTQNIGLIFIKVFFIVTTVVIPLTHLYLLVCFLFLPLYLQTQRKLFIVIDILHAWSCLDVFVVSIVAAVLEIEQFSQFIIGDKCKFLQVFIDRLNPLLNGDDKCFDVIAQLNYGCWILFGACILHIIVTTTLMRKYRSVLEERLKVL